MKRVRTVFSLKMWYQKSIEKYSDVSASSIPVMIPTDRTNIPHMLYNPILVKMHYAGLLHLHALHAVIVHNPLSLRGIPLLHGTQYPLRVIWVRILHITSPSNSHLHHQLDRQHSLRLHLRLFSPTLLQVLGVLPQRRRAVQGHVGRRLPDWLAGNGNSVIQHLELHCPRCVVTRDNGPALV